VACQTRARNLFWARAGLASHCSTVQATNTPDSGKPLHKACCTGAHLFLSEDRPGVALQHSVSHRHPRFRYAVTQGSLHRGSPFSERGQARRRTAAQCKPQTPQIQICRHTGLVAQGLRHGTCAPQMCFGRTQVSLGHARSQMHGKHPLHGNPSGPNPSL